MRQTLNRFMFLKRLLPLSLIVGLTVNAQNGDKKDSPGEKQVARVPAEKIPPSPVLTAEEAIKSFKVAPGFHIEVVAAEPLVHDPVAMAFDPEGRIWVAELTGYMRDYEGTGERDPIGTVAVLEDTNGDGKMDKRTVFLDGLKMPRAVSLVRGGVLIAEPPHLWFCRDTNGDLKSDEKREIVKDYGDTQNPEHTANGLLWALDNWIYSADWTVRLKSLPEDEWKREQTAFRGQWGISQDDYGRLVYNSNSDQYRMDLVPSAYLQRNPHYQGAVGLNVDPIHDESTYPARVTPGVNRGYRDGTLRADGTLAKFTAACAPLIYRGDNFPTDFYGNAFVCEPSANLIKRNILWEEAGEVKGCQAYTNAEFIASTDERFRPVNLNNGPDGALYIVDLYRGVIQHKIFLTTYLRQQSESRKLEAPIGYGRIYRVVSDQKKLGKSPNLMKSSPAQLVDLLSNPNGWVRDTAQRLLVERADFSTVPSLKKLATSGGNSLGRLHALWTLEGIGGLDVETVLAATADMDAKVKAAAIRLSEAYLTGESKDKVLNTLLKIVNDPNSDVQLQLAFTFGQSADSKAQMGMAMIARNASKNIYIRDALLTGLGGRELEFLEQVTRNSAWTEMKPGLSPFITGLAQCVFKEGKTNSVNRLFELAASANTWQRASILDGIVANAPAQAKGKPAAVKIKPIRFAAQPEALKKLQSGADADTTNRLATVTKLVTWPGQSNYEAPPVVKALNSEEQKRFDTGKELFSTVCAACHQPTGQGMEGLAPPLVDSEWVLGSDQRLARILLHGVKGKLNVKGKVWELEMPGLPFFDDEQIAAVLTYIRRDWDHAADPVNPATVKKVREETTARVEAWTEAELLKVK